MITTYKDFLMENKSWTENDPEYYNITDYEWNQGKLNVNSRVIISKPLVSGKLPFPFGVVNGSFVCDNCGLTTLENCPDIVKGSFSCKHNLFKTLQGGPSLVYGTYNCSKNYHNLLSLEYLAKEMMSIECDYKFICDVPIDNYPIAIYNDITTFNFNNQEFAKICKLVYENQDIFRPLLDDKKAFHLCVINLNQTMISHYTEFIDKLPIEDFPIFIPIHQNLFRACKLVFDEISNLIYYNQDIFIPLLNDKIKFHQQIMRMRPDLISEYKSIAPPSKKTVL